MFCSKNSENVSTRVDYEDDESCSAGKKSLSPPPEDVNHVLTPRIEPPSNSLSPFILHVPRTEDCLEPLIFDSATAMLDYVTLNWKNNFVTTDICTRALVEIFIKRPFFMLISVDAPLLVRYSRLQKSLENTSLECFLRENDELVFGNSSNGMLGLPSLRSVQDLVDIHINNDFNEFSELHAHLENLNLLDPQHLRPSWDAYFMTLASLASRRSNCMKRRVGAILVRENRILATGYNGTPRGLRNCNEGGCGRCNGNSPSVLEECVCLHAEENALLEAGRERVGINAVLYCNTCPCLKCTVKIIQTGIKTVVYNLSYKMDDASALLFQQAGVQLRRFDPSQRLRFSAMATT
ncbi:Deoxycytidine monophosphate (dCMP) deaminase [Leucoagaricus gongylophorus]